jgi:hypothetical protein
MGLSGEELDAASPQEIRDWLVRTLKEKQPDITQSTILAELAMPHYPEVGDRIRALEKEHREAVFAMQATKAKVVDLYVDVLDSSTIMFDRSVRATELLALVVRAIVEAEEERSSTGAWLPASKSQ